MDKFVLIYLQAVCPVEHHLPWHTQCSPVQDLDRLSTAPGARHPRTFYSHPASTEKYKYCINLL